MAQPDLEAFAKATMRNLGRDPDDWRAIWNSAREFRAMMQAWEECMAQGMVEKPTITAGATTWNMVCPQCGHRHSSRRYGCFACGAHMGNSRQV